jgi:crossover junction endodeoxyribonuclease RuvC
MFLWIDPGIRKLWYALIDSDGKILLADVVFQDKRQVTRQDQFARLVVIYDFFVDIFAQYPIKWLAIEHLYFTSRNQWNAEFVYGVRWLLLLLALKHNVTIHEYSPIELKKYITGNSKASKEIMMHTICKIFQLQDDALSWHDTADALGLAYLLKHKM